ncbi:MAG: GNAT family N-acetyltransferase [Anaerolineales bacterium]
MNLRQTSAEDRASVEGLIASAPWSHAHLDWLDPISLTNKEPFLLAAADGIPVGLLGCPPDLPGSTWLRSFAVAAGSDLQEIWDALWKAAVSQLQEMKVSHVAAISLEDWFAGLIKIAGFDRTNSVIFYERELDPDLPLIHETPHKIRSIRPADTESILELDRLAFDSIWQLSSDSLAVAMIQASSSSLIEDQGKVLGYQITTSSPFGAHLARLAVKPSHQREGLGTALVADAIEGVRDFGLGQLSVNTQEDNTSGRILYEKLGFRATGKEFPVFEIEL